MSLRGRVFTRRCSLPVLPIAVRTALMRLNRADSETIRPCQNRRQQLADHAVAVTDQMSEQVEYLRLDGDEGGSPTQPRRSVSGAQSANR